MGEEALDFLSESTEMPIPVQTMRQQDTGQGSVLGAAGAGATGSPRDLNSGLALKEKAGETPNFWTTECTLLNTPTPLGH